MGANSMRTQRGRGGRGAWAHTRVYTCTHVFLHTHTHVHSCSPPPQGRWHPPGVPRVNMGARARLCSPQSHMGAGRVVVRNWMTGVPMGANSHPVARVADLQAPGRLAHPGTRRYSLLWEEIFGFPMYLRMGLRFLSSRASLSFLALLLCWNTRGGACHHAGPEGVLGAWGSGSALLLRSSPRHGGRVGWSLEKPFPGHLKRSWSWSRASHPPSWSWGRRAATCPCPGGTGPSRWHQRHGAPGCGCLRGSCRC